jgi:hypothetical protein
VAAARTLTVGTAVVAGREPRRDEAGADEDNRVKQA